MFLNSLKYSLLLACLFSITLIYADSNEQESKLFPEGFIVYVKGNTVINHYSPGFEKKVLPTKNLFTGTPGGYIACYSHIQNNSIYGVSNDIFVMGQIRLAGQYFGRIFQPKGYENKDISAEKKFKNECNSAFSSCQQQCWAGGDTGGWFGI